MGFSQPKETTAFRWVPQRQLLLHEAFVDFLKCASRSATPDAQVPSAAKKATKRAAQSTAPGMIGPTWRIGNRQGVGRKSWAIALDTGVPPNPLQFRPGFLVFRPPSGTVLLRPRRKPVSADDREVHAARVPARRPIQSRRCWTSISGREAPVPVPVSLANMRYLDPQTVRTCRPAGSPQDQLDRPNAVMRARFEGNRGGGGVWITSHT